MKSNLHPFSSRLSRVFESPIEDDQNLDLAINEIQGIIRDVLQLQQAVESTRNAATVGAILAAYINPHSKLNTREINIWEKNGNQLFQQGKHEKSAIIRGTLVCLIKCGTTGSKYRIIAEKLKNRIEQLRLVQDGVEIEGPCPEIEQ